MKKDKQKVIDILTKHPKARGNDNELYYWYFKDMYKIDLADIRKMEVDKFVSLARIRRMVQVQNPFLLPSKSTQKKRKQAEEKIKEEIRKEL